MKRKSLGNLGENLALKHLESKGYKFIERNFRSRFGEIDLIFQDKNTLVFVEVKTRLTDDFGTPELAVTKRKISSIKRTGKYYKLKNPQLPDSLRIDVVAIQLEGYQEKSKKHFKNITL